MGAGRPTRLVSVGLSGHYKFVFLPVFSPVAVRTHILNGINKFLF